MGKRIKAMQEIGLDPLEPYPGKGKSWESKCLSCGKIIWISDTSAMRHGARCEEGHPRQQKNTQRKTPSLTRRNRPKGQIVRRVPFAEQQDERYAEMLTFGVRPIEPFHGVDASWKSICLACDREVKPRLCKLRKGTHPCRTCRYRETGLKQRIPENLAVSEMLAMDLEPQVPYPGLNKAWLSKCLRCGNPEVHARLGTVRQKTRSCGCENSKGYKSNQPSRVYIVTDGEAYKIGVMNIKSGRLREHNRHGWNTVYTLDLPDGRIALDIEGAVLKWVRADLGIPCHYQRSDMKQNGWSETIDCSRLTLRQLVKKVSLEAKNAMSRVEV